MAGGVGYRCEATTVAGFIQQLAVSYVKNGFFFYVTGSIREGRDPCEVDRKLGDKYGFDISKFTRARRKKSGQANIHYIRHGRFFVLLASAGEHRFFREEAKLIRDCRRVPIKFEGYAVAHRGGRSSVRIERGTELNLKAYFEEVATKFSAAGIARQFWRLPFEPYKPVRRQLLGMLREVNRRRQVAGLEKVDPGCVRWKRLRLRPFDPPAPGPSAGPSTSPRPAELAPGPAPVTREDP